MTTYAVTVHEAGQPDLELVIDAVDVAAIAPVLSAPLDAETSDTTAEASVTTDRATGTLYVVSSAALPSAAQIKAGNDSTGAAAEIAESQAVTAVGVQTVPITGLTAETAYAPLRFMHEDADANQSNVVSGDGFTTDEAAAVAYAPAGTEPSGNATHSSNTIVDRSYPIANGATIETIGLYLSIAKAVTLKIVKRDSAGQYDVVVSESFAHPGGGWVDKTLDTPFVVPATGDYYPACYASTSQQVARHVAANRALKLGNIVGDDQTGFTEAANASSYCLRVTGTIPA